MDVGRKPLGCLGVSCMDSEVVMVVLWPWVLGSGAISIWDLEVDGVKGPDALR